ncbi:MAG: hypothetical protein LQ343_006122 [Gyalolechia ehrenbergii]|nr:MAG: hypothetical protein LQ343_006122 [Gyalolechia ehrenbergii]
MLLNISRLPEDQEEKRKFKKANDIVRDEVVARASLIAATTNAFGGPFIKKSFGRDSKNGVVIFMEEASQELESNAWMFTKLRHLSKVRGVYLIGDQEQLKPAAYSATANPRINEFAPQLCESLFNRLINNGFPSVKLNMQYRAHPDLMELPNMRTYGGAMQSAPRTWTLVPETAWTNSIKEFLGGNPPGRLNLFLINVTDSMCQRDPATTTRFNTPHVNVGIALLQKLLERDSDLSRVFLITPYAGQKSAYLERLQKLSHEKQIPTSFLPEVLIASSIQGREADIDIYDSVLSTVGSMSELGIQEDEGLMNVVHTRARYQFIMICSNQITKGDLADKWKAKKDLTGRGVMVPNPLPYLIQMANNYTEKSKAKKDPTGRGQEGSNWPWCDGTQSIAYLIQMVNNYTEKSKVFDKKGSSYAGQTYSTNQPPPIIRTLQPVDEKGDEEVAKGAEGDDSVKSKKSPPGIPQPLGSPKGIAIGDWITAPCAGTDPAGAQKAESADEEW